MKKLLKGAVIGVLGLGLALGLAAQADAMPGYTKDKNPYDASCKSCHATDPYAKAETPAPDTTTPTTPATPSTDNKAAAGTTTTLPKTGVEGMYLNYLAGAGLLVPGAALLASRKKQR